MNIPELQQKTAELHRLAAEADGLQKRYGAYLMLYDAACMAGRDEEVMQRRDDCHTLLDSILDNAASVHRLTREVHAIVNRG